METILLVIHVFLSLAIIGLVLLQRGKGAEAGAALGGGASGTVFGARGAANFLSRSTAILAAGFFVTSLSLAYLASQQEAPTSVTESVVSETVTESEEKSVTDDIPVDVPVTEEASDVPAADIPVEADLPATETSDVPAAENN